MPKKHLNVDIFRSIMFGFEDSLVSTTGVVVGISAGTQDKKTILLAAFVTIIVEALSMGAGQFITQKSVTEYKHSLFHRKNNLCYISGFSMFFSYLIGGMIPVLPMILFSFPESAFVATLAALVGLFILGYIKGKIAHIKAVRSGLEILFIGGIATIAGLIVGIVFKL